MSVKKFLWQIPTTIAYASLVVLLISAFSDRVSPFTNSYIPFLGLFFPFILLFNVLFFLFWLIFKKWAQAAVTIGVFLICWGSIHTYFPLHTKTKTVPEDCIKILTYNVMRFEHMKKHTKENPNPIIQYVIDQDPDIVCFQEYGVSTEKSKTEITESDAKNALKHTPYYTVEALQYPYSNYVFGLAVFSKYPILSTRKLPIESDYNGSVVIELDINGRKTTLINNHLESNKIAPEERSDYYNLTKDLDTQKLEAFTHTMFQRLTPAFKLRAGQADLIAEVIKESKNPYIIVCGDFNDTPISYARHKIKGDLTDSFVESGSGMGITFNMYRFLFRIDYLFHSKNIKAYNCTVGNLKNSDHYPVWTYLQFKD
ncbi:MAG: endonuclease/exonuclease/phosphatase family protein [Candidatus Symbiothrix sp.]|jgi:endonuclease/exonuclease/phosphatase family metal-dependent hydrolase|nr:endonuclease/exonuclease/phosphatase family protein [Candidatus Symbiothrix sp.]